MFFILIAINLILYILSIMLFVSGKVLLGSLTLIIAIIFTFISYRYYKKKRKKKKKSDDDDDNCFDCSDFANCADCDGDCNCGDCD